MKPDTPSATKQANQQFNWYKKAALFSKGLNAGKTVTPWGTTTVDKNGNTTLKLGPAEKQLYSTTNKAKLGLAENLPTGAFEMPDTARADQVEKALYERRLGLIKPELDQADAAKRLELSDRGIPIGSEVYNTETDRLDRNRANALAGIAQDATLAGGQESDRLLSQALTVRNQPFNEWASMVSASPIQQPQIPSRPSYSVGSPDLMGAYANQQQQQNNRNTSMWNGLFNLGSSFLLSDERAKTDVERVGETDAGLPIYTYKYRGAEDGPTFMGLLAQDVEDAFPDAVARRHDGLKAVDYARVA